MYVCVCSDASSRSTRGACCGAASSHFCAARRCEGTSSLCCATGAATRRWRPRRATPKRPSPEPSGDSARHAFYSPPRHHSCYKSFFFFYPQDYSHFTKVVFCSSFSSSSSSCSLFLQIFSTHQSPSSLPFVVSAALPALRHRASAGATLDAHPGAARRPQTLAHMRQASAGGTTSRGQRRSCLYLYIYQCLSLSLLLSHPPSFPSFLISSRLASLPPPSFVSFISILILLLIYLHKSYFRLNSTFLQILFVCCI